MKIKATTGRPRNRRAGPNEDDICKTFMQMVDMHVLAGRLEHFDVFHINNGERSGGFLARTRAGARAKAMGQRKGVADYVLFGKHYLEIKSATGRSEPEQKEFAAWCGRRGLTYKICKDAGEALDYVLALNS